MKNTKNIFIISAAAVLVTAMVCGTAVLFGLQSDAHSFLSLGEKDPAQTDEPLFPQRPIDPVAELIETTPAENAPVDKPDISGGGGSVTLTYTDEVDIDLSEELVTIMFQNPTKSTHDLVLQLVIVDGEGEEATELLVAESGIVMPGYKLSTMKLQNGEFIQQGVYKGKFKVVYYAPETNEKAILNTEIPLEIEVRD